MSIRREDMDQELFCQSLRIPDPHRRAKLWVVLWCLGVWSLIIWWVAR